MVPLKDHVTLALWHYDTRGGEDMYLQEYPVEIPFDLKDYSAKNGSPDFQGFRDVWVRRFELPAS